MDGNGVQKDPNCKDKVSFKTVTSHPTTSPSRWTRFRHERSKLRYRSAATTLRICQAAVSIKKVGCEMRSRFAQGVESIGTVRSLPEGHDMPSREALAARAALLTRPAMRPAGLEGSRVVLRNDIYLMSE